MRRQNSIRHESRDVVDRAGYQSALGEIVHAPYLDMALPYAAGSLYSTVEDLYKSDQALYTDKLLPADLKQKIFTPGLEHYGYGWTIDILSMNDPAPGQTMIAHGGGINGFGTLEQRLVSDHVLIVLLNNTPDANLYVSCTGRRQSCPNARSSLPCDTVVHRGVEAAIAQYAEVKRTDPDGYDFAEPHLNYLGHMLLDRNCTADPIAIFKLNAQEYPKSGEVYDSLADAYEKDGRKQLAIENYRKAVNIDPDDRHGKDKLKALENN